MTTFKGRPGPLTAFALAIGCTIFTTEAAADGYQGAYGSTWNNPASASINRHLMNQSNEQIKLEQEHYRQTHGQNPAAPGAAPAESEDDGNASDDADASDVSDDENAADEGGDEEDVADSDDDATDAE